MGLAGVSPPSDPAPGEGRKRSRVSALESVAYRQFLLASFIGSLGGWIAGTAQGWLVLDLTGSSAALGWTSAAGWLPFLLLSPAAGVLADRIDARRLITWTRLVVAICASVLAGLVASGAIAVTHVIALALAAGSAYALAAPAMQAMVGTLVRGHEIGAAVALNSAQFNLARMIGPPIAGVVVAAGGIAIAFWANAVAVLTSMVAYRRLPRAHGRRRVGEGSILDSLAEGIRWLRDRPELLALVLMTGAPALLTLNYAVLLPVFARDQLGVGAAGLGVLAAAAGVGAFAGAIAVAVWRPGGGSGRLMLGALSVMTVTVFIFSLSTWFALSVFALVVVGGSQVAYYTTANTLLQTQVPSPVLGRVLSLYAVMSQGLIPVGNVAIGQLADAVTARVALAAAAGVCLASIGLVMVTVPGLLRLEGRRAPTVHPSGESGTSSSTRDPGGINLEGEGQ
jgi:MFS family permease